MPPNEPAPTAPFTDKDRAMILNLHCGEDDCGGACPSLTRALAYITHLEGAVEAADELARAAKRFGPPLAGGHPIINATVQTADAYLSARAALPTSKEDAG